MGRRNRRRRRTSGLSLLIAIDKPYGMVTRSMDNMVANALGDDGVGHVGTLDPAVTGVVVLGVGQAKRLIPLIEEGKRKRYVASIRFGYETETDDAEGARTRVAAVPQELYDEVFAAATVASFEGAGMQRPPRYSAIKVDGVRAYDRARAGEEFELPERPVEIFESRLLGINDSDGLCWECEFLVSPGTYVRSMARDLGRKVGSAAHLASLRRTASGLVGIDDCVTLERVQELGASGIAQVALDPTKVLGIPTYELTEKELGHATNGRPFVPMAGMDEGQYVCLIHGNRLYGVWRCENGLLRSHINCTEGVEGVRL